MPLMNVCIPENIRFSDLRLARDADGMVSFDWTPIDAICKASGIDLRELAEKMRVVLAYDPTMAIRANEVACAADAIDEWARGLR